MTLYDYFRSSASFRVRIALAIKNVPADTVPIHLVQDGGQQHQASYLNRNPQGRVPSLALDDGQILTQSLAIIEYLDEVYPTPALLPSAPLEKATVRAMAYLISCDVHPLNNLSVLQYLKSNLQVSGEQKTAWYHHWIHQGFKALEVHLKIHSGQFCYQDQITLADLCLIPQVYNAKRFDLDMSAYPLIRKVYEKAMAQEAFYRTDPDYERCKTQL